MTGGWLDRLTAPWAPRWTLRRQQARLASEAMTTRYYDAASRGRRTEGWRRSSGDGNAAAAQGPRLRTAARNLHRNNAWARSAVTTIADHVVGWGLTPKLPAGPFGPAWTAWAETAACDADGRRSLDGLARQALETIVLAGEVLVRRRIRRESDGLPLPLQLQLLEPDYLDDSQDRSLPTGGQIVQGIEYGPFGRVEAYWLFPTHPGSNRATATAQRIPATEILHVALPDRPGTGRGVSWFAPVLLRLADLDDFLDAQLMKQKVAACLSVIITGDDGSNPGLLSANDTTTPAVDTLEPGMITSFPLGKSATVVQPPSVNEHDPYTKSVLREVAAGLGLSYEDLTGDFSQTNFSSARMARLRHWDRVYAWRHELMIPQFYAAAWAWAAQVGAIVGAAPPPGYVPTWTAPPMPMLEPDKEGLAYARNIRAGITTLSEALRELGYDPKAALAEMAADWREVDRLGLVLDSDPRKTTQAGQLQGEAAPKPAAPALTPERAYTNGVHA